MKSEFGYAVTQNWNQTGALVAGSQLKVETRHYI